MTEIDPSLYRLLTFQHDWLMPLVPLAQAIPDRVNALLIGEAYQWISLGQITGYFRDTPVDIPDVAEIPRVPWSPLVPPNLFEHSRPDGTTFGRFLEEAQDDLTSERQRFLHLILLATEKEWRARLRQASDRAQSIVTGAARSLSLSESDAIRWIIEGRVSEIREDTNTPAYWRSNSLPILSDVRPGITERLYEVDEVIATLVGAAEFLLQDEDGGAGLREQRLGGLVLSTATPTLATD